MLRAFKSNAMPASSNQQFSFHKPLDKTELLRYENMEVLKLILYSDIGLSISKAESLPDLRRPNPWFARTEVSVPRQTHEIAE